MKKHKAAGLLRLLVMGDIADVSKMRAASIFRAKPEDGGGVNFRNEGNVAHTTRSNNPRTKLTPTINQCKSVKSLNIKFFLTATGP
jgi:hypothetical protein